MREIGINLHAKKGLTDKEYLREIASLGFKAVFSGAYGRERQEALADLCAKYSVRYETLHAPFGHINDIWLDCEGGQVMLDELKNCVDCCAAAGVPIAVVHLSSGQNPPPVTDIGRERFGRLIEHASKRNVKIAFENQRMLANIAWVFEAFRDETVGFCWDCGHEFCFTPGRKYMPLFGNRLICTHIHDNAAVFNADDHLLPFDGKCDFDYVASAIRESGYTGSLMLEIVNETHYAEMTPHEFLEKAVFAVKKLRQMVDGH